MLGMSLLSFLVLTLIGAVVAVAYHNVIRYRFLEGNDALFGKLIVGWLGAWLGPPVFGHWLWKIENVYVVPAILGAAATGHLTILPGKALTKRSFSWMMASRQDAAFWRRSQLSVSEMPRELWWPFRSLQPPAAALSEWKQTKSSAWQSQNFSWLCHSGIRISARSAMKMCGRCWTEVPLRYPALLEFVSTSV